MRFSSSVVGLVLGSVCALTGCGGGGGSGDAPAGQEGESTAAASAASTLGPAPRTDPGQLPAGAQAISFLGEALYPPDASEEVRARQREQLQEALADLEEDPDGAEALIWVGRRHAYLGEYRQAIEIYTRGIRLHPQDPRFLRHRGHRYITIREPELAIADFRLAAQLIEGTPDEVEPDGQPNAMGIPTSTLHFNIWYHFGLAHYVKGEFAEAADIYRRCMEASVHADSKVATAHWWYMTLRRLGREAAARELIQGMDLEALRGEIIESGGYLDLLELYAGAGEEGAMVGVSRESLEGATAGYGYGNWLLYNGDPGGAREVFRGIVDARTQWAAFGYIAAEADLSRM